ncbi:hypothetical protein L1887_44281 [Cichorium endivia]|nr:hypothetical protein L1887_44281 [Cichorium endivia]
MARRGQHHGRQRHVTPSQLHASQGQCVYHGRWSISAPGSWRCECICDGEMEQQVPSVAKKTDCCLLPSTLLYLL